MEIIRNIMIGSGEGFDEGRHQSELFPILIPEGRQTRLFGPDELRGARGAGSFET